MHWRRKWQPAPVFLPGESQGQGSLGLPSVASHRVGHDWSDLAAAAAWKQNANWRELGLVFSSVQFSSVAQSSRTFVTPWTAARQPSLPSPTPRVHRNPCPSSRWCHPTIFSSVVPFSSWSQSFPASGSFPIVSSSQTPKYWSFSFNISPSNEHPGLISFRMGLVLEPC